MIECLVDGEISDRISASDRGLQFGDGLFETIAVIGGQPRFWQLHMDRLGAGCERLGIPATPQPVLLREVKTVCAGQSQCIVRIIVTRGESERTYSTAGLAQAHRVVSAHAWQPEEPDPGVFGVRARLCNLRLGIQPDLAGMNHLNRLEQVLARAEWDDPLIDEGILLDREDHVICGVSSNIFLVYAGRLLTPRLDRCGIRGVMRAAILGAFRERCEQRRLLLDMLPDAEEVFICNSVRGAIPLTRIGHWEYEIGPVTREVREWLKQQ
ncbi:MAG: aminodeoxychorismate lyase [Xanthomonadales bacterium]|jgi:4-amino-4-deoxychorismate lyase|nr:aminodeoxychorismate lyase [Xanthomonadales bacterium]MDH4000083.1 aminodeoxychorismate lyase [Xanthomonadales bacterium]